MLTIDGEVVLTTPPDVRSLIVLNCQWCGEDISGMTPEIEAITEEAMGL